MQKTIVITGATRGLGRALAEYFAAGGHRVLGCGRDEEQIRRLGLKLGAGCHFTKLDVANDHAVGAWAEAMVEAYGPPDLAINNAALMAKVAPVWKVPLADINATLHVNIRGTVSVIRHFVPAMIAAGRGVIANLSSGWGRSTSPEVAIYCASKFAVEGLTKALAQELPEGMAAVAVNPGIIATDMLKKAFGEASASYPEPSEWVRSAGPFFLGLGAEHNGLSLDVPGAKTD